MSLVISLVGRPNVGKSTLFNRLTKSKDALVADIPGLTRDRQYGIGKVATAEYIVIDSGGLIEKGQLIEQLIAEQVWQAVAESDIVFFIVDGRAGVNASDFEIARSLRKNQLPIYLLINKSEGLKFADVSSDFYQLGLGEPYLISAAHNIGIQELIEFVIEQNPIAEKPNAVEDDVTKVAIVGRPNVGKSTLINRLIGENRLLAYDSPGTTRDSIAVDFVENGKKYSLIDTAGVRRRGKVKEVIEKFSVIKTIEAIKNANVVVVLIDGQEGFTSQDASLLAIVVESGKALVLGVNKWDGLSNYHRQQIKSNIERKLHFIDFAPLFYVSALHGSNIRDLFNSVEKVYQVAMTRISTNKLTNSLLEATKKSPPPLIKGHRIKLRYAHQGGQNPPLIIIHGNQTNKVPDSYCRYLINHFRNEFNLKGTPINLEFKTSNNPYAGKKNKLNKRQIAKELRLKKHNKS